MPPIDLNDPEIKAEVEALTKKAVEEAVSPLKAKNEELIGEKRNMQRVLSEFDAMKAEFEGHEELKKNYDTLMQQIGEEEDAELIRQGRIHEVIERRNERFVSETKGQLQSALEEKEKAEKERDSVNSQFQRYVIEGNLRDAAVAAGVHSKALEDVIRAGAPRFTREDDGSVVMRDANGEIALVDNKIVSPKDWIESRKEESPHWWPASSGSGMNGAGAGFDTEGQSSVALAKAVSEGDMDAYRELRQKKRGGGLDESGRGAAAGGRRPQ